ncbi:MAG TPA: hypothetical protein VN788_09485, partial [Verrucomicrobiae bacterium]|nr:hypothetical protein [Verrucomicrobiae bacterium]
QPRSKTQALKQAKFDGSVESSLVQQGFDGKAKQNRGFGMPLLRKQESPQVSSPCGCGTHPFAISPASSVPLHGLRSPIL